MNKEQINKILSEYELRVITPLFGRGQLANKLIDGLESILSGKPADISLQIAPETTHLDPLLLKNTGDISFYTEGTKLLYGIGNPIYACGKVHSTNGMILVYFLSHQEKDIGIDEIKTICKKADCNWPINHLMRIINRGSKVFKLAKISVCPEVYKLYKV